MPNTQTTYKLNFKKIHKNSHTKNGGPNWKIIYMAEIETNFIVRNITISHTGRTMIILVINK